MRKAAAHWKGQATKLKEEAAAAAPAPDASVADGAALAAATERVSALEQEVATLVAASAALQEQLDAKTAEAAAAPSAAPVPSAEVEELRTNLDKFRRAAHHWKKQYDTVALKVQGQKPG